MQFLLHKFHENSEHEKFQGQEMIIVQLRNVERIDLC